MTCQHCQTWVLDEDHRCPRCGRRIKATPPRISPQSFPIAAAATAAAYEYEADPVESANQVAIPAQSSSPQVQQALFSTPISDPRVIPFESLSAPASRESIRARAAEIARPAPLKTEKQQLRHAGPRRKRSADQPRLDLFGENEIIAAPASNIICDAPVAPASLQVEGWIIDGLIMAAGAGFGVALFRYLGGQISLDKHALLFLGLALATVPFLYGWLWTVCGRDTFGMRKVGLRLVDFDGNPPSHERRYLRLFGSLLSVLAAGVGLIWLWLDPDSLTWHDHISSTFPTIASDT